MVCFLLEGCVRKRLIIVYFAFFSHSGWAKVDDGVGHRGLCPATYFEAFDSNVGGVESKAAGEGGSYGSFTACSVFQGVD